MACLASNRFAVLLAVGLLTTSTPAQALKQPDGTTIPQYNYLQDLFKNRGEGINALNDAQAIPETFKPTCKLQFEVLQRNAGYKNAFGWYNVTGKKPAANELYEFLSCNDPVGTKKTLSIKKDPKYLGGDIAFFQATGSCGSVQNNNNIFFSEKKYNPDGNQQNPYIHLLIYNSTVTPKAFYFCWEDLLSGGDNDFDDLTTFVSGIGCTGSGAACKTGKLGLCAEGTMQCQNGMLQCLPLYEPSKEICDGIDNDCSGVVDEGNLCPEKEVCDKGTCVPKCGSGEFKCPPGKVCDMKGLCVDPACEKITCPENTKCDGGKCVGPCDGVTCPYGQVCLAGACADPCSKFKCDPDQVCQLGACVEKCDCAGCKVSETCQPDGKCIPSACANKTCKKGEHCDDKGNCVDNCANAVCPKGQICKEGNCAPDPNAGMGGAGGDSTITGGFTTGSGGEGGMAGTGMGGTSDQPQLSEPTTVGGCGCVVVGNRAQLHAGVWASLAIIAAMARRAGRSRGNLSSGS